jgi:signal transduction histidine kinase
LNVTAALVVATVGTTMTALVSIGFGMSMGDSLRLAAIAAATAAAAGAVGGIALRLLHRRPLVLQIVVVAVTTIGAIGAGAWAAAQAMFLSTHDLHSLMVVLLAGGTIAALTSLVLGERVSRARADISRVADRIGRGESVSGYATRAPREFESLAEELEQVSARLEKAREQERAVEASRRELIAWVSHDLRTPLAGIRAMVEALSDGVVDDSETVSEYYESLQRETDRLSSLVDDLFELSRINAGALNLQIESVSLGDLVSDALAATAGAARKRGVKLEGRLVQDEIEVDASTPEISRALLNLVENAIRHTPSDGAVWVEGGVQDRHAYLSVADECGGIPDQEVDRVFDLAWRGESARTPTDDGGGGLGLAIARGIVEAHHGDISVRNHKGGCSFTMRLPLKQAASTR